MKANRNVRGLKSDNNGMIAMLPTVAFAIIMLFAILYIGTYINGTIGSELIESYPATLTDRTLLQNRTVNTLGNLSLDFDSTIDIVVVAVIIVVLTIPLMAVVAIKRLL